MSQRAVVVLLGASNIELALSHALTALSRRIPRPFDLHAAIGHGRSLGRTSRYLARELPSILDCGLWRALESAPKAPVFAVVADVGNDLMYGSEPDEIATWVETALGRLDAREARRVVVGLPRERIERVTPFGFALLSRIVFPFHPRRDYASTRAAAMELDDRLRGLARGGAFVEAPLEWFGLDPIHVRRGCRASAWDAITRPLGEERSVVPPITRTEARCLARRRAERRAFFGRWSSHAQPQVVLGDGSRLSFH